ncbi:MAG: hypothetical protein A3F83_08990 [Candidatus Glassbacteria bacterium RIFCSPLOWO2_12_FULL_58_11]|uniref:Bifunctional NAD(P)H-hydrate repair enzyme n=1 Tax=Candidatus Glassbacteria bacterium RIFCSPLOWO2_12_FULL_58_11 TaxID=1817867 RepID=A0A1F5YTI7_9BACT|nr:MAG: hypothetical protein A3F83_08990 [Candidatus Glassbacteria bacterium RIFCSPLOWO2_12_FULL_58_11]
MQPVLTAEQMRRVDRATIDGLGLPGTVLMESAGRAVAQAIREFPATSSLKRPLVLCGKGNNGGDGFVVARALQGHSASGFPRIILCGKVNELSGDAALMARVAVNCGIKVIELDEHNLHLLAAELAACDMVVDALLGSGAGGAPHGLIARVIETLQEYQPVVVAVDSPSGVEMDSGQVPGAAVTAVLTVTFGFEKIGHRFYPGRSRCGKVLVADIGFPEAALSGIDCKLFVCEPADIRHRLPVRRADSHKGDYGKVLVVGGSTGLTGAAVMAAEAALVAGAGMVTAGVPQSLNPVFEAKLTEAMTLPLPDTGNGFLAAKGLDKVLEFLTGMDVLALGPGLGRDEETVKFARGLARAAVKLPVVIDADGLNAFAAEPSTLEAFGGTVVITPHPGEMARLCGSSVEMVRSEPVKVAREFAESHGVVVALKGPPTVVAGPGGRAVINPTGGPAMAKAGSGDVLTGIIAGLLAQGLEPFDAAFCGSYLHGLAGDIAAGELGPYSVVAGDILARIGRAIGRVNERD